MKTYRIGLIGFGFIGRVHAYCVQNLGLYYDQDAFGGSIVKVCTSRPETAAKAAAVIGGGCRACTDFREITEDPEIDIVDIASPNDCHAAELESAMRHGKHIYCDKPLTQNFAETRGIAALLPEYRGIAQLTLMYRFFPAVLRAKELVEAGKIGDILEFHANFMHSGSISPETPYKWKLGAGTVADLGSHVLDVMQYLMGPFKALTASTFIAYPERRDARDPEKIVRITAEDAMHCILKLANGAVGTVCATKVATGTEDELSFTIHGTKGALKLEPMNLQQLFFFDAAAAAAPHGGNQGWTAINCGGKFGGSAVFPAPKAVMGWLRGHVHCYYHFLESVTQGVNRAPDLADGIALQMLLEKVRESAKTGKWVDL